MAVISPTSVRLSGGMLYKWETVTENDTCEPVKPSPSMNDKTFFATGTFGSGTIGLLGTLNPDETSVANFAALNDHAGNVIAESAAGAAAVAENCISYAPGTPTGSSVDLDVWLLCVS